MDKKIFHQPLVHVLLLLVLGILCYSNTFQVPFVFDDGFSIVENPDIRNLSGFLNGALSGKANYSNRYVGFFTFALNYRLGGFEVPGYHLVNLLVHLVNALLVYSLVRITFRTPRMAGNRLSPRAGTVALFSAILFIVHPLQTQAVTYIVQRLTSLATTFYLSTFVLYVLARLGGGGKLLIRGKGWLLYSVSLATAVLAMRTKEITFTLPILLLLYESLFFEGPIGKRFLVLACHLVTLLIIPLGMLDLGRPAGEIIGEIRSATEFNPTATRYEYMVTQFCVIVTYFRMLFWPTGQNIDHDYPVQASLLAPRPLISLLFLFGLFTMAIYLTGFGREYFRRKYPPAPELPPSPQRPTSMGRLVGFGILWFFIALSVESSIIPITDVIFEHRVYLPSVGAFTAIAAAFVMLLAKVGRPGLARGLEILAACAILALAVATWKRNEVWREPANLWQDAATKSPHKARPFNNLGAVLGEEGRMDEAITALYQAARLQPGEGKPFVNLGAALASVGRMEEAADILSRVVRLQPDNPDALNNLGIVLKDSGRLDDAIAALSEAVRIRPDYAKAHYNLGRAFLLAGRRAEGVSALRRAIELKADYDNAYVELAAALNEDGRYRDASALLKPNIVRLSSRPDARYNLGVAAHCTGDGATATRELVALQRLDARYAEQLTVFLGRPCSAFHGGEVK